MRGNPVIQSLLIVLAFSLLGFAGAHFIQGRTKAENEGSHHHVSDDDTGAHDHGIAVEIECHFSDMPMSYTLRRPNAEKGLILKASGSQETSVYHDITLPGARDHVLWLDVAWDKEKLNGQYFVQLILSIGDQEPREFFFRTHTKTLNGTIQLDLSSIQPTHEH